MTLTTEKPPRRGKRAGKRRTLPPIVPALVALVGIALLLYPVFATQHNDAEQQRRANGYSVSITQKDPGALRASLAAADKYNEELAGGLILDPFLQDVVPDTPEYQAYLKQLNVLDAMSQLKIPSVGINLPVYHGTSDDVLEKGVGHLFGSSLPVGGVGTHTVLTGHTGLGDATLFNDLDKVKKGDAFYFNTAGRKLKYVVKDIRVVLPTQVSSLKPVPGEDLATLITCTPYGINSHRLLVTGERAPLDADDEKAIDAVPPITTVWKWWMVALLIAAAASVVVVGALITRMVIARRKKKPAATDVASEADATVRPGRRSPGAHRRAPGPGGDRS